MNFHIGINLCSQNSSNHVFDNIQSGIVIVSNSLIILFAINGFIEMKNESLNEAFLALYSAIITFTVS